jgi:long-chain acyl-CoA synthetase
MGGNMEKMTGKPSIDKPWLKYYDEEVLNKKLPEKTIYEYITENNKKYPNRIALNYFGKKITYGQLLKNIDQTARAFRAYGIREGDIVTICMPTIPETIYVYYALSKIGAIANMVDPRTSKEGIENYINEAKSKMLIMIDVAADKARDAKKKTTIEKIITVSPTDSLPLGIMLKKASKDINSIYEDKKEAAKSKHEKEPKKKDIILDYFNDMKKNESSFSKSGECIPWSKFFKSGKKENYEPYPNYEKDKPLLIVHTGGTTGPSKGVVLSNFSVNAASFQCENAGYDFKREHSWLNIMPPFIAYGIGNGLHLPLSCGMEVILIPQFDPNKFDELLLENKPNHMVGVPSHYGNIIHSKKLKNEDLSYVIAPTVGGDKMDENLEKETNEFLREHNCEYKVVKGYGMTEVNAAVAACTSNETNKIGSVGIPFPNTTISIFDPKTGEELGYNEKGEVCITGPNTMLGYFNNDEETNKILRKHEDGNVWVHSGDIGYMDADGNLYIVDRLKRMIIRPDGFKIFPSLIEDVVVKHPLVQSCKVVGLRDFSFSQGKLPKVHVVLNETDRNPEAIENEILMLCEEQLPEYYWPCEIEFNESLPLTPIGKIDYLKLEKEDYEKQLAATKKLVKK